MFLDATLEIFLIKKNIFYQFKIWAVNEIYIFIRKNNFKAHEKLSFCSKQIKGHYAIGSMYAAHVYIVKCIHAQNSAYKIRKI